MQAEIAPIVLVDAVGDDTVGEAVVADRAG